MLLSFEKQLWNHCANSGDTQAQADCIVNGTVDFLENDGVAHEEKRLGHTGRGRALAVAGGTPRRPAKHAEDAGQVHGADPVRGDLHRSAAPRG